MSQIYCPSRQDHHGNFAPLRCRMAGLVYNDNYRQNVHPFIQKPNPSLVQNSTGNLKAPYSGASFFYLGIHQFIQNSLFWASLDIYFERILGAFANCLKVLVRGRLGEPLRQVELFGMQNTLERYVAEGLAVSRRLVVHNRDDRF
jgi:hypothetical protein